MAGWVDGNEDVMWVACSPRETDINGTFELRESISRGGKEQTKGGRMARGVEKFNCAYFRRDVSQILLPTTTTTTTTNIDAADPSRRIENGMTLVPSVFNSPSPIQASTIHMHPNITYRPMQNLIRQRLIFNFAFQYYSYFLKLQFIVILDILWF